MNAHAKFPTASPLPPCPVCAGAGAHWLTKGGHALARCTGCGHGYLGTKLPADHVARQYGDTYFFGGGDGYPDYLANGDIVRAQGRAYARIAARHAAPGRMIDIGAAAGFTLKGFIDAGWTGTGIEPNAAMRRHGRDELGVTILPGDAESFSPRRPADLVTMIQVAGHLHNLDAALANVALALKPGGLCLIDFWDRASAPARLMGAHWHEISPPSVVHWFADKDLDLAFARHGMTRIDAGRPAKKILGAHAAALIAHKLGESRALAWLAPVAKLIPSGLVLPYPALDLRWVLYRKDAA